MPSFFTRLPTELQAKVLQTIINTGAGSLIPFLRAFPDLAHLVLLISDHTGSPFKLVDIPGVVAVDLEDHQLIARLRPAKPITVLSFKNCDEEAGIGRLTRSSHCAYGKYMDSKSAVFVELRGKALLGNSFIRELAESKGCVLGTTLIVQHLRKLLNVNHVEVDRTGNPVIKEIVPRFLMMNWILDDPEVPWMIGIPLRKGFYILTWRSITHLTILNALSFCYCLILPHVQTMRFSSVVRKCRDTTRFNSLLYQGGVCVSPLYGLDGASQVKNVYIEFRASKTPALGCGPSTCSRISEAERFSFINLDWSEDDPVIQSALCPHALRAEKDYLQWSINRHQPPLGFLKIFKEVTFVGIPDYVLLLSTFTNARAMTWKRLTPREAAPVFQPQSTIHCPSLESLQITSLLRRNDDKDPMPKIHAPVLQSLDLCALCDSNTAWDLQFHLTMATISSVQNVSMIFKHNPDTGGFMLRLADIEPLSPNLQSLSLKGCFLSFLLTPLDTMLNALDSTVVFSRLTRLSFDLAYLPLENIKGKPRPLVSVFLDCETFPVLEHLTLSLEFPKRSPLLSGGVCNIKIQISSSCQVLTVSESLLLNELYVIMEDEQRCHGKTLSSSSFVYTVGEPGFMSVSLTP